MLMLFHSLEVPLRLKWKKTLNPWWLLYGNAQVEQRVGVKSDEKVVFFFFLKLEETKAALGSRSVEDSRFHHSNIQDFLEYSC